MISTDRKKDKYNYLFCSKYKGNCKAIRIREEVVIGQIKQILENLVIPDDVLEEMVIHLKQSKQSKRYNQKLWIEVEKEHTLL